MTMKIIIKNIGPGGLRWSFIMILVGLISSAQSASAQTQAGEFKPALVVAPMQSDAPLKNDAETLTELIRVEVGKSDRFVLVTAEEIGAVDAEIKRQLEGGCDESTYIAELGGAVGARYLITSRLQRIQSRYIVVLKLIDIERVAAVDIESIQEAGQVALIDRLSAAVAQWLRGDSPAQTTADEEDKREELAIPVIPQGVVITGSRTQRRVGDATIATEVISRRDIVASGAETLADLLEEHPGADVSRSFRGAGLRLQGLDDKHVLILMDGERTGGGLIWLCCLLSFNPLTNRFAFKVNEQHDQIAWASPSHGFIKGVDFPIDDQHLVIGEVMLVQSLLDH